MSPVNVLRLGFFFFVVVVSPCRRKKKKQLSYAKNSRVLIRGPRGETWRETEIRSRKTGAKILEDYKYIYMTGEGERGWVRTLRRFFRALLSSSFSSHSSELFSLSAGRKNEREKSFITRGRDASAGKWGIFENAYSFGREITFALAADFLRSLIIKCLVFCFAWCGLKNFCN